jgi:hypothetical protein
MSDTVFCYHCRVRHPLDSVRQIETRTGKRWRCIKSIEATKGGPQEREAFGRRMTELNKTAAEYRLQNTVSAGPALQIR